MGQPICTQALKNKSVNCRKQKCKFLFLDGKVHLENASSIWTPDLFIYNLIKYNIKNMDNSHFVLSKNGSYVNVIHFF